MNAKDGESRVALTKRPKSFESPSFTRFMEPSILSHNKYIDNQCIEHLIRMTSKLKRPRAPLKVYLFQTSAQREHFQATASRRVELIF